MGLFGHFVRQGIAFRFFAPIEIMFGHCQVDDMILLKPNTIGWETIGNAIAVPHAVFALAHALLSLHPNLVSDDATSLVLRLIAYRLKASTSMISSDSFAWYVSASVSTQELQRRLHFFPPGTQLAPPRKEHLAIWSIFLSPGRFDADAILQPRAHPRA